MTETGFCTLSQRQREVLQLAADGHQAKDIARVLNISHRTVQTHWLNLRTLLGGETITHAVAIAMRAGLIQ